MPRTISEIQSNILAVKAEISRISSNPLYNKKWPAPDEIKIQYDMVFKVRNLITEHAKLINELKQAQT